MKSNIEWEKWGERDPLFAVATWSGKERGGASPWTDGEFYELGRAEWAEFVIHWQKYGVKAGKCLEIGCGAGRLTKQLLQYFQHVTAVDVSQHQLDYARQHIPESNVTFTLSDGNHLPMGDQSCDGVFSAYVFQHFESFDDAIGVFREVYRVLNEGGTLMIHLPLYNLPDSKAAKILAPFFTLEKRLSDVRAAMNRRLLLKGTWKPMMRRLRYDRWQLAQSLCDIGFSKIEFSLFSVQQKLSHHEFLFATKQATGSG